MKTSFIILSIFAFGLSAMSQTSYNFEEYFNEHKGEEFFRIKEYSKNRKVDGGFEFKFKQGYQFETYKKDLVLIKNGNEKAPTDFYKPFKGEELSWNNMPYLRASGNGYTEVKYSLIDDVIVGYGYDKSADKYLIYQSYSFDEKKLRKLDLEKTRSAVAKLCKSKTYKQLISEINNDKFKVVQNVNSTPTKNGVDYQQFDNSRYISFSKYPSRVELQMNDIVFTPGKNNSSPTFNNGQNRPNCVVFGNRIDFRLTVDGKTYDTQTDKDFLPAYIEGFQVKIPAKYGNRYNKAPIVYGLREESYQSGDGHFYIYAAAGRVPLEFYFKDSLIGREYVYIYYNDGYKLTPNKNQNRIQIKQVLSNNRNLKIFQSEINERGELLMNTFHRPSGKYAFYRLLKDGDTYTWNGSKELTVPKKDNAWQSAYAGKDRVLLPSSQQIFVNKLNQDHWGEMVARYPKSSGEYIINSFYFPKHGKYIVVSSDETQSRSAGPGTSWQYRGFEVKIYDNSMKLLKSYSHGNNLEVLSAEINGNRNRILINCRYRNEVANYVNRPHLINVETLLSLPNEFPYYGIDEIASPPFQHKYLHVHSYDLNKYVCANSTLFFSADKYSKFSTIKLNGDTETHEIKEFLPENLYNIRGISASDKHLAILLESKDNTYSGIRILILDMSMNVVAIKSIQEDIFRGNDTWDMEWDITNSHLMEYQGDFYLLAAEMGDYDKNNLKQFEYLSMACASSLYKISIE